MNFRKWFRGTIVLCLCVMLLASCLSVGARELTLDVEYVKIPYRGYVADSFNGVEAIYNPWGYNYSCAELVSRYFRELYGLELRLPSNDPTVQNTEEYWFEKVEDVQPGDVLYASGYARGMSYGHWAICEEVNVEENYILLFEQNWRWNGMAGVDRRIALDRNCYNYYRLVCAEGTPMTLTEKMEEAEKQAAMEQVQSLCQLYRQQAEQAALAVY